MEGMFRFGFEINARRRSFIRKNWNFKMHLDTNARSFQGRKCTSSLTLWLWRDMTKLPFLLRGTKVKNNGWRISNRWRRGKKKSFKVKEKKTCETEFFTNFPLVTCASALKDINRDDKYRKYICILKYRRSFCFYRKVSSTWKNAQTAETQIAWKMSGFFKINDRLISI